MAKFIELPISYDNDWIMAPINIDSIAYIRPTDNNFSKIVFSGGEDVTINRNFNELSAYIMSL